MPSDNFIKNLINNATLGSAKQNARLRFFKRDIEKFLQKSVNNNVNLQYSNGETLALSTPDTGTRNRMLGELKKLGISKSANICTDPKIIFDEDHCFRDAGKRSQPYTHATVFSCNNLYNNTEINDRGKLIKTLTAVCVNYRALSDKDMATLIGVMLGFILLLVACAFCINRHKRSPQVLAIDQNDLRARLAP